MRGEWLLKAKNTNYSLFVTRYSLLYTRHSLLVTRHYNLSLFSIAHLNRLL
jgi:hypothetical protein